MSTASTPTPGCGCCGRAPRRSPSWTRSAPQGPSPARGPTRVPCWPRSTGTAGTSWLPPGWNQPYLDGRTDEDGYNSSARSYADRPVVSHPHALHFMGLSPAARYRHMAAVAKTLPLLDPAPSPPELGASSGWPHELVGQQAHQQPAEPAVL